MTRAALLALALAACTHPTPVAAPHHARALSEAKSRWHAARESQATTTPVAPRVVARASRGTGRHVPTTIGPQLAGSIRETRGRDVWWSLALCESGGRRVTPGPYHSYFQWALSTWRGLGMAGMPEDYSYEAQRAVAQRLYARSGRGQWPICGPRAGLA